MVSAGQQLKLLENPPSAYSVLVAARHAGQTLTPSSGQRGQAVMELLNQACVGLCAFMLL